MTWWEVNDEKQTLELSLRDYTGVESGLDALLISSAHKIISSYVISVCCDIKSTSFIIISTCHRKILIPSPPNL